MGVSSRYWAAIRRARDDGHEFFDMNTLSIIRDHCEGLAVKSNEETGELWAADNPVVRFSRVEMKEVEV